MLDKARTSSSGTCLRVDLEIAKVEKPGRRRVRGNRSTVWTHFNPDSWVRSFLKRRLKNRIEQSSYLHGSLAPALQAIERLKVNFTGHATD